MDKAASSRLKAGRSGSYGGPSFDDVVASLGRTYVLASQFARTTSCRNRDSHPSLPIPLLPHTYTTLNPTTTHHHPLPTMTLYYSLVFALLVFEMVVFMSLIVPMPFSWKRKLLTFISENPVIAKLQYWIKVRVPFLLPDILSSTSCPYPSPHLLRLVSSSNAYKTSRSPLCSS
jgi:hypothetical protein